MNGTTGGTYRKLEWTDDQVARFWRWQAEYPEAYFTYQFGNLVAARLKRHLAGCETVVDYGCGPGFLIPHLVALGKRVTGADFSPAAVDAANARFGGLERFDGAETVDRLIEEKRVFDAAVSIEVIEHLNDGHLAGFFNNLKGLMRPGGMAIITTPNDEDLEASMVYCPASDVVFHRWQHVRSWCPFDLSAAVEKNGFSVVDVFTTDLSQKWLRRVTNGGKELGKRGLGRPTKRPHLVCVALRPS